MTKILNLQEGFYDLDEGNYLLLINPERIPHLVYLQDGRYYSLTYKGLELAYSFAPYFERLLRAKKKIIFLELDVENASPFKVFTEYVEANENGSTCFYPIKDLLCADCNAEMIIDLIPELYKRGIIKSAKHYGMQDHIDENGDFKMSEYSKDDIYNYIAQLKEKYVERD